MEDAKEDIKKYPSLPPNYVSLAQLQERWLQQQQQKQKKQEQNELVASQNLQGPKEKKRLYNNPRNSKNGEGRIDAESVHVHQNGEGRVDSPNLSARPNRERRGDTQRVYVPRRQSGRNHREIWEVKSELKSEKLEMRASGDEGGDGTGNVMNKKYNQNKRRPWVEEGLKGEDPLEISLENGGISGVVIGKSGGKEGYGANVKRSGHEKQSAAEIVSVCMVGLVPEIKGKEMNPVGLNRKLRGKQVVNGQFLGNFDDRRAVRKSHAKEEVNVQFLSNADDRGVEGSVNGYMVDVLRENVSEEEVSAALRGENGRIYNAEFKRSADDKGIKKEGNVCPVKVLQDNAVEEEVSGDERRRTGKERFRGRYQGNEGNSGVKSNSNDNNVQLELGQPRLEQGVFMDEKERDGPKARTGRGVQGYGNKDRVSGNWGPKIRRDFGDLSLDDSRKGNVTSKMGLRSGQRGRTGNFGRFISHRKGKQAGGGLVWVKKEEISNTNAAEISSHSYDTNHRLKCLDSI